MKIIDQSHEILTETTHMELIPLMIELAGRTCYKSEDKITDDSANNFCRMLIKRGHEAMIEHGNITVRFITNRGVTHEQVRHRIAAYGQESTRYVNYKKGVNYIQPVFDWATGGEYRTIKQLDIFDVWFDTLEYIENAYIKMIKLGCPPQEAREVLPNSLKTEIVVTANIREWRHILKLRTAKTAHPQIRELMLPLLAELKEELPALFEDIGEIE